MENLVIEDAKIMFKHFSGDDISGKRSFAIRIDDLSVAEQLISDGWPLKAKESTEDNSLYYLLNVTVSFDHFPPSIFEVYDGTRRPVEEFELDALDHAFFKKVDLIINPYHWTFNKKSGIKAYLKSMYYTIDQDELSAKYRDLPFYGEGNGKELANNLMFLARKLNCSEEALREMKDICLTNEDENAIVQSFLLALKDKNVIE